MSVARHFALAAVLVVRTVCAAGVEVPVVFWASDPVRPGEVVVVQGGRWGRQPKVEVSSSPWRTENVDRVDRLASENIGIARTPTGYAVVPLELLGFKPQPGKPDAPHGNVQRHEVAGQAPGSFRRTLCRQGAARARAPVGDSGAMIGLWGIASALATPVHA